MKTNYMGLSIGNRTDLYISGIRKENNETIEFKVEQEFLKFQDEPFSQLGFFRRSNNSRIFLKYNGNSEERIPAYKAGNDILIINGYNRVGIIDEKSKWMVFEILVSISAIIATHMGGFEGIDFSEWFKYFLRELSNKDEYPETIEISFPEELEDIKKIKIPLCGPSLSGPWNKKLGDYLSEDCGANIGTLYANTGNQSRDFYIQNYKRENILSGECKLRTGSLTKNEMKNIVNNLINKCNSKINMVLVNSIVRHGTLNLELNSADIYLLSRSNKHCYKLTKYNGGSDARLEKNVFIVIDSKIING